MPDVCFLNSLIVSTHKRTLVVTAKCKMGTDARINYRTPLCLLRIVVIFERGSFQITSSLDRLFKPETSKPKPSRPAAVHHHFNQTHRSRARSLVIV